MELRAIWEIICRRRFIIIQAFWVIFLGVILTSFLVKKYKPTYQATARLFIATAAGAEASLLEGINLRGITRFVSTESITDNPMETQVALITARPIIEKVIKKLELKNREGKYLKAEDLTESRFIPSIFPERKITVEQYEETDLLEITAESGDSKEAVEMANTLSDIYIEETKKLSQTELMGINRFVDEKIKSVLQNYTDALSKLKEFRETHKTINLDKEVTTAIEKMADLYENRETSLIRLYEEKVKLNTVKTQLEKEVEATISASVVSDNPQIELLKRQLTEQRLSLVSLRAEYTDEHPEVIAVLKTIANLKEELAEELAVHRELAPSIESLEKEIAAEEVHLKEVDVLIEEYSQSLLSLPSKEYQLAGLQLAADATREIYGTLLKYSYEIDIASMITFCNVRMVEPAELPEEPSKPDIVTNTFLGIFLGIMVGLGLGFVLEYVDDTVKSADDVKEYLKLPLLGVLPLLSKRRGVIIGKENTPVHLSDTFWRISHNIKIADVDKEIKSLLVTSSCPNEGKTIVASNLAITFAQKGKNVLLVDADFLKPGINSVFKVVNKPGLIEVLTGEVSLEKAIQPAEIRGLSLLTCGEHSPAAGKLLESEKMRNLLDMLVKKFDIVIYDSAPLLAVTYTVVLASEIKNLVFIVEAGNTSRKIIAHAQEILQNVKANVLGLILNKYRIGKNNYYYYYYRYTDPKKGERVETR